MKATFSDLSQIVEICSRQTVKLVELALRDMSTSELDNIPTIKVSSEIKAAYDSMSTIIDVLYPNDNGVLRIYLGVGHLFKIIT